MEKNEINNLFERYSKEECSEEERRLIDEWLTFGEFPELIRTDEEVEEDLNRIQRVLPLYRKKIRLGILKIAAAALLIGVFTFGLVKYFHHAELYDPVQVQQEVFPEGAAPILTLANGERVALYKEKSTVVINASELTYQDGSHIDSKSDVGNAINEDAVQSLETPYGTQYQVILSDGTKVWLNAGSKLRFPSTFKGKSLREVHLDGEGYFEVSKNKAQPFIVRSGDQNVEVLGTHFNVKNYRNSEDTKTSLLEGAVRVTATLSKTAKVLKPGQQAVLKNGDLRVVEVEPESISSWKDGVLDFRDEALVDILREIERAYNVQVFYKGNVPKERLFGKISKNKSLQSAINILELSSEARFEIEGRKILVSAKQ